MYTFKVYLYVNIYLNPCSRESSIALVRVGLAVFLLVLRNDKRLPFLGRLVVANFAEENVLFPLLFVKDGEALPPNVEDDILLEIPVVLG